MSMYQHHWPGKAPDSPDNDTVPPTMIMPTCDHCPMPPRSGWLTCAWDPLPATNAEAVIVEALKHAASFDGENEARVRPEGEMLGRGLSGLTKVHDLHIWGMSTTETALTAQHRFGIQHAIIQIESGNTESPKLPSDE